MKVRSVIL